MTSVVAVNSLAHGQARQIRDLQCRILRQLAQLLLRCTLGKLADPGRRGVPTPANHAAQPAWSRARRASATSASRAT